VKFEGLGCNDSPHVRSQPWFGVFVLLAAGALEKPSFWESLSLQQGHWRNPWSLYYGHWRNPRFGNLCPSSSYIEESVIWTSQQLHWRNPLLGVFVPQQLHPRNSRFGGLCPQQLHQRNPRFGGQKPPIRGFLRCNCWGQRPQQLHRRNSRFGGLCRSSS